MALKIIVATILERRLAQTPTETLALFFSGIVLLLCTVVFFWSGSRDFSTFGNGPFNRNHIKCSRMCGALTFSI